MAVTHSFVNAIADDDTPAGAVGPDEWNDDHDVDIGFLELNDVPATYVGQAGKFAKVNVSENGLSFGTVGSIGGSPADELPGTPDAMDDEFNDDTDMSGPVNGLDNKWSWVAQSTSTITYPYESWMKFLVPNNSGHQLRGIVQTLPSLPATFRIKWGCGGANANAAGGGIWLYDHVNGDSYWFGILYTGGATNLRLDRYTSLTSGVSNIFNIAIGATNQLWTEVVVPTGGGLIVYGYSTDGVTYTYISTTDITAPTRIGLAIDEQNNSGNTFITCDYFRRTA